MVFIMELRYLICSLAALAVVFSGGCIQEHDSDNLVHANLDESFVLEDNEKAIIEPESLEIELLGRVEPGCSGATGCIEEESVIITVRVSSVNADCLNNTIDLTGKAAFREGIIFETCDGTRYSIKCNGYGERYPGTEFEVKRATFVVSKE